MVAQNIFFYVIAAAIVYSGLRVVTSANVVHAALHLVVVLAAVAAQYVLLAAEFVAATQVLVYIGAIIVLFLFGIMLTRAKLGRDQDLTHKHWVSGAVTAVVLFAVMAYALVDEYGWSRSPLPAVLPPAVVAVPLTPPAVVVAVVLPAVPVAPPAGAPLDVPAVPAVPLMVPPPVPLVAPPAMPPAPLMPVNVIMDGSTAT